MIQRYFWKTDSDSPKGTILVLHGHGSYLLYDFNKTSGPPGELKVHEGSWIQELLSSGFNVCGLDHASMGFSQGHYGLRGYFHRFQDLVDDAIALARDVKVREGFAGQPLFLLACSMGGCVAVTSALQEPKLFAGAALLAPMLSLERVSSKGINAYLRPIASLLSVVAPTLPCASTSRNTRYPDLQELFEKDPVSLSFKTRARVATEYLARCEELATELRDFETPFIVFHSEADDMVDPASSKMLYLHSSTTDKELVLVNQCWHILQHEVDNRLILDKICKWFAARGSTDAKLKDAPLKLTMQQGSAILTAQLQEAAGVGPGVRMGERAVLRVDQLAPIGVNCK